MYDNYKYSPEYEMQRYRAIEQQYAYERMQMQYQTSMNWLPSSISGENNSKQNKKLLLLN